LSTNTVIEWTDMTWNPVTGCSKVSAGCTNCYAERLSHRFGWTEKPWNAAYAAENVRLHPERLYEPLRWRKPRRVFVNSMSDLFHPEVPDEFIWAVFKTMAQCPRHTFQILTKRPERMLEILKNRYWRNLGYSPVMGGDQYALVIEGYQREGDISFLPNVWLGVSVENQEAADERIPLLLQTPAAVRFLSCEPLLGPVDVTKAMYGSPDGDGMNWFGHTDGFGYEALIHWVIVGGESGPNARPMHPEWVRSLRDQCQEASVAFFFKQWGEWFPRDQWEYNPELVLPDDDVAYTDGPRTHVFEEDGEVYPVHRVGKKAAGRILDGRTWDEYPTEEGASR
jgi:protein gp37